MNLTDKCFGSAVRNFWSFQIVALIALTVSAQAATVGSRLPDSQEAFRQAASDVTVSQLIERGIVAGKLHKHGFSGKETLLLLRTLSSDQSRQLASTDTLARSGGPRNAIIALLTAILLITVSHKLTDGFRNEQRSAGSRFARDGADRRRQTRRRGDSVNPEDLTESARSRPQMVRRKTGPRRRSKPGIVAAMRRKLAKRGR